jgi:hypothetical protein
MTGSTLANPYGMFTLPFKPELGIEASHTIDFVLREA